MYGKQMCSINIKLRNYDLLCLIYVEKTIPWWRNFSGNPLPEPPVQQEKDGAFGGPCAVINDASNI